MYLSQGLSGDHSIPRSAGGTLADRLLHGWCNAERSDGSRDHLRPALTGHRRVRDIPNLGRLVMATGAASKPLRPPGPKKSDPGWWLGDRLTVTNSPPRRKIRTSKDGDHG